MKEEMFQELIESVKEAGRIRRGEIGASRTFRYDSVNIKQLRNRRGLTQNRFAHIIGVSPATLQGWEQGRRVPQGPAMALLRVFDKSPEAVEKALEIVDSSLLNSIEHIEFSSTSTQINNWPDSQFMYVCSWHEEDSESILSIQDGQEYCSNLA